MEETEMVAAVLSGRWPKPVVGEVFGVSSFVMGEIRRGRNRRSIVNAIRDEPVERAISAETIAKLDAAAAERAASARANFLHSIGATSPNHPWVNADEMSAAIASGLWPKTVLQGVLGISDPLYRELRARRVAVPVSSRLTELLKAETIRQAESDIRRAEQLIKRMTEAA